MPLSDGRVLRLAVESGPAGILLCDQGGTIIFANRQIEKIFGYAASELAGRSIDNLLPTADRAEHALSRERFWEHAVSRPMAAGRDLTGRRKDGSEVPIEVEMTVTEVHGGKRVVASVFDVSDRLALQRRIVESADAYPVLDRFVMDLASTFVMVQPDQVDAAILEGLARLGDILDLDRCTWWRVAPDQKDVSVANAWARAEYHVLHTGQSGAGLVPWILSRVQKGKPVTFGSGDDIPSAEDRESLRAFGVKSGVAVPFNVGGEIKGVLGCTVGRHHREWPSEVIERLRLLAAVFGRSVMRRDAEERLRNVDLQRLRDELASDHVHLRPEIPSRRPKHSPIAESPAMQRAMDQLESVAGTDATVLLLGETGSGKEVFAEAIHSASDRRGRPMVTVNCAALPATLIESELFGRERGAYTGALARQIGRFEMADHSTIFLDEIGDLPQEAQVKLLRVIQERVVERLGGGQPIKVNARIIAATNRDLEKAIANGTFREDLFYRLNVFPITVPPLRERIADIPALTWAFIDDYSKVLRKPIESISKESLAALKAYHWPGNVRELRNVIERALIVAKGTRLVVNVPNGTPELSAPSTRLDAVESDQIRRVLEGVGWRVRGRGGAAELLGLKPTTLESRMAKLGIHRPSPPAN
jgi:PAS domain S-box-containing protein